ncbi:hypothetical protein EC9_42610 [Rosistilla ulvae]|uniref:NolW-like domain-containing protein n=1 Tax=Rosistilla ulvae TaxID=1930277 RepID=A0A517M5A4_9BACT|nr:DUF4974 domain-containing protein [Rosistilla ulvae]QDS90057.1 hypothetical protein EC9_42610 [Rosistilla ulvae]
MKSVSIVRLAVAGFMIAALADVGLAQSKPAIRPSTSPSEVPPSRNAPDPFQKQVPFTTVAQPPAGSQNASKPMRADNSETRSRSAAVERIEEALARPVPAKFHDEPFGNVVKILADKAGIPIRIDRRALEDLGLTADIAVTTAIDQASLEGALSIILRDLDLTHTITNEHLVITSVEAAESQLITRIYWAGETGLQADRNSVEMIVAIVTPGTWEELGGPSVIRLIETETGSANAFVVTTTYVTHRKLQQLLDMIAASSEEKVIAMEMKSPAPTP